MLGVAMHSADKAAPKPSVRTCGHCLAWFIGSHITTCCSPRECPKPLQHSNMDVDEDYGSGPGHVQLKRTSSSLPGHLLPCPDLKGGLQ